MRSTFRPINTGKESETMDAEMLMEKFDRFVYDAEVAHADLRDDEKRAEGLAEGWRHARAIIQQHCDRAEEIAAREGAAADNPLFTLQETVKDLSFAQLATVALEEVKELLRRSREQRIMTGYQHRFDDAIRVLDRARRDAGESIITAGTMEGKPGVTDGGVTS